MSSANEDIDTSYFRYGGSITFSKDNWEFILAANSPVKGYDGFMMQRDGAQYAAIVQYKYCSWAFGAQYNYKHGAQIESIGNKYIDYENRVDWVSSNNLFKINIVYSFNIGRARKHGPIILNDSDATDGLNKFNNAHH